MLDNAEEVRRLHARINETYQNRGKTPGATEQWKRACEEFHARYDALAFPGGYDTAVERIAQGDPEAIEAALCFVELRPYFFRSGYMFKTLMRKLKRAPLDAKQSKRFEKVVQAYEQWRQSKREPKT
jgi:hypothetical protein